MNQEIKMSKQTLDAIEKDNYEVGFRAGYECLIDLIGQWKKSGLSPKKYYEPLHPTMPNPCLGQYFCAFHKGWLQE